MKRLISWVSKVGFVSLLVLYIQASALMAADFQRMQVQQPLKGAMPVTAGMMPTTGVTPATDAFDCLLCYTCGYPAPHLRGILNSPGGTYEWGEGCGGSPQWTDDQWPYLCCHD